MASGTLCCTLSKPFKLFTLQCGLYQRKNSGGNICHPVIDCEIVASTAEHLPRQLPQLVCQPASKPSKSCKVLGTLAAMAMVALATQAQVADLAKHILSAHAGPCHGRAAGKLPGRRLTNQVKIYPLQAMGFHDADPTALQDSPNDV
mmetsp:Transcript_87933/g.155923  ORF Transcript_87933/g.155923 Transcript_87933/m.155923 type:complete len:147 (-) Transcript_87933:73-513(-)